ncbi:ABC transporter substrate-binding protein [Solwaraspora sp. WMMD1047]|uniref:ABC transporter substrate-binding protein n=1 Tax=Solwaraspora sp. WMMD1047 TaxID=3016102 RepID=UPI002417CBE5|nr:ABC transporter substrate-binding protein [Solwaraspora sp. WMMD1047]MDG4830565.1 ABC transporter substrate-binding protein [Solwaraspora sp. WMMD1047]
MGYRRSVIAVAGALTIALAGCGGSAVTGNDNSDTGADGGPVKIGFLVPKSGVYASIGTDLERAMQVYLEEHENQLGGREVEMVVIDEGSTPQTGTAAARRLVQQEQVAAVTGIVNSATAVGVATVFSDAKVPVISTAQVTENPYWWRVGWTNPMMNTSIVDYLVREEKDKSVYLIGADYKQGHDIIEAVKGGLEAGGVEIAGEAFTPFGTTQDFQPYLSEIRNSGADSVYAFYAGAEAASFVTQYSQFGLSGEATLYGNQALTEGTLSAQGTAASGVLTNSIYTPQIDSPVNKAFVDAYVAKFDAQPSVYSEAQYASAAVLDKAIAAIGDGAVTGEAINGALPDIGDIETPRGTWRFDAAQAPTQTIYLRRATETGGVMTNEVIAELGVYTSEGQSS